MITGKPKARHAHRRDATPNARRIPLPPPRQAARLTGGPLAGCTVHIEHGQHTVRAPGHAGRYVRTDADDWAWETDHRSDDA